MIIAVDGPVASGKGTIATKLAEILGYAFLDTGRLYRAVALLMIEANEDVENIEKAEAYALSLKEANIYSIVANPKIRDEKTGLVASKVAAMPKVRSALLDVQRNFAHYPYFEDKTLAKGAVLDGRDIGTLICPEAEAKLFVTASPEIRAERRYKELQNKGISVIYEHVLADMKERDERDKNRTVAPLVLAKDAYLLDTSLLDINAAVDKALAFVRSRIEGV